MVKLTVLLNCELFTCTAGNTMSGGSGLVPAVFDGGGFKNESV
jgi:hypothetical protein